MGNGVRAFETSKPARHDDTLPLTPLNSFQIIPPTESLWGLPSFKSPQIYRTKGLNFVDFLNKIDTVLITKKAHLIMYLFLA